MNNGFKYGLIVFAVLMFACCGGFMYLLSPVSAAVSKREAEAKNFGDTYTKQILRDYSAKTLTTLSTKEYKSAFTLDQFQKTLDGNSKALGEFQSGKGRATISNAERKGKDPVIRAKYENRATFQKGKARVRLDLILKDNIWQIEMFSIEPA